MKDWNHRILRYEDGFRVCEVSYDGEGRPIKWHREVGIDGPTVEAVRELIERSDKELQIELDDAILDAGTFDELMDSDSK